MIYSSVKCNWSRCTLVKAVTEIKVITETDNLSLGGKALGAVIMLGTLFGLIALIVGLVFRFDPQARGSSERKRGQ